MLADLLEATREAVMVTGPTLRITAANQPAKNVFSRYGVPLEGMRLSEVIRDLKLHDAYRAALEAGLSSDIKLEIGGIQKRKFDVHVGPVEIDGEPGAMGFYYDITQLERLENVRQEFLSNVSHELRTPLTSILAFVETLEDGAIDDEENNRRFLSVIRRNAERMRVLISDILELSLIESGKIHIELRKFKLANLVDEVFASLSASAAAREIGLINEVPLDVEVSADVVRKEQMLTNLIDNAIKFNRDAGTVTVSHSREGGTDTITVADTGEGLAHEHIRRIFERFYRVDRARSREIGGTGLGLAIVKHLAKLHGGEVSAESVLGEGTKFEIRLPVR
jgi:two-component system phosphate regulon sensor histidine kinase PhoR